MNLGDKVRDIITGFEGIVMGECRYLTGCEQRLVMPQEMRDGKYPESTWLDIDRLALVQSAAVSIPVSTPGGDKPAPTK